MGKSLKWEDACVALLNDKDTYSVIMLVEEINFPAGM